MVGDRGMQIAQATLRAVKSNFTKPYFEGTRSLLYNQDVLSLQGRGFVDLVVTSPPYNVDIHYNSNNDDLLYKEYLDFTRKWLKKCYTLAKPDGRLCLNIPLDKNKGGQQSVCADITALAKQVGWCYHSTIIWNEGNISRRTAWGSWMSASAPYVIAPVEVIVVLYKKVWKKQARALAKTSPAPKQPAQRQRPKKQASGINDISRDEFMQWTNGVWSFSGQNKKGAGGHPAPFPVELPRRCIKLFSFVGDVVLDPFCGSGSTLIAAQLNNRIGLGVDVDQDYCNIAIERLKKEAGVISVA